MSNMYSFFGFIAVPLGYVMEFMYNILHNYGWTIILFTLIVRLAMFPLTLKQQKATAKMSAYQPMIQEIQKKWANDKNRQNQEMQKFYQENNVQMSPGCLPMIINMIVLFGIIAVIQAPLNYMLHMPAEQIAAGVAVVEHYETDADKLKSIENTFTQQSILIGELKEPDRYQQFIDGVDVTGEDGTITHQAVDAEWVNTVRDFNFRFLGMDLSQVPSLELNIYLILPILSILTMFASQFIIMKTSGGAQQQQGTMWIMTIVMGAMFGFYAFTVPTGFSLYYTASNIAMTLQQLLVRKIHDPEKIKQEIMDQIEENKKAKKAKKTVAIAAADGSVVTQDMSEKEVARLRLEKARQMDAERYGLDGASTKAQEDDFDDEPEAPDAQPDGADAVTEENADDTGKTADEKNAENAEKTAADNSAKNEAKKPGRRRRATIKEKEEEAGEEPSFADKEMENEEQAGEQE